jgi:hypothetical protein
MAQQKFDRAVALLHSFAFPDTVEAFTAIAEMEPSCAMAYWGVAISQRPNPLAPPFSREALRRGEQAIAQARAASQATPRERAWIEALAAFYKDYGTVDQHTRTRNYEAAMARLHVSYPDDDEAAIFYALALNEAVDLTDKAYARQLKAAAILERLEPVHPNHPGIPHYIIHSYDYPALARLGLYAAVRCSTIASAAPHALHMPAHIFSMLGMWDDVVHASLTVDAVVTGNGSDWHVLKSDPQADNPGRYHSLDFLVNAYLQTAQDRRAKEIVDMRNHVAELRPEARYTAHTAFAAIPIRYAFERGAWDEAAKLEVPRTPYPEAEEISWFGRALGAARSGDVAAAKIDLDRLHVLKGRLPDDEEVYWTQQFEIDETAIAAWIALAEGHTDKAIELMRRAADQEDRTEKNIAMENRLSPMRELLGELLLEAQKPALALVEFEASLQAAPNRYRSVTGASRAAERLGDSTSLRHYSEMLVRLGASADTDRPELIRAREYVAKNNRPSDAKH